MEDDPDTLDGIKELINIGVGKAAGILGELTSSHVILQVPTLHIVEVGERPRYTSGDSLLSMVFLDFSGPLKGRMAILFSPESAANLVILLTDESDTTAEMDMIRSETLTEIGNILINGVMGTISNFIGEPLTYALPVYTENRAAYLAEPFGDSDHVLYATTQFQVKGRNVQGDILIMLEHGSLFPLIRKINAVMDSG
ncbi:MAG: chemotaxis protein CheC [Methanolinea sp.]|jgi:chemotaxis protein CheC|nr:chemotaxis protein CheC [Methanolinea sp.]